MSCDRVEVTLYTRAGCCLCDSARAVLEPIIEDFGADLVLVDVDANDGLRERFGSHVPVVEVGADVIATYRVDPERARAALMQATRREVM